MKEILKGNNIEGSMANLRFSGLLLVAEGRTETYPMEKTVSDVKMHRLDSIL